MTTNKPEVKAYLRPADEEVVSQQEYAEWEHVTSENPDTYCGYYSKSKTLEYSDPLIRLSNYEALQAEFVIRLDEVSTRNYELRMSLAEKTSECEKLLKRTRSTEREYSKTRRALKGLERVAKVVSDNSDIVCEENNQLRVECEKLRIGAELLQTRIEVIRQLYPGSPSDTELDIAINTAQQRNLSSNPEEHTTTSPPPST